MKPTDTLERRVALRTLAVLPAFMLHGTLNAAVVAFNAAPGGWQRPDPRFSLAAIWPMRGE